MRKTATRWLGVAMLATVMGRSAAAAEPASATGSDAGYFLSLSQKGQLIWKGQIQDSAGTWYDIWIVPGYVAPTREVGTHLRRTGSDFAEYVQAQKYEDLAAGIWPCDRSRFPPLAMRGTR